MGVLGDERNPARWMDAGILVCNHYGCPIKAGYARRNLPVEKTIVRDFVAARPIRELEFMSDPDRQRQPVRVNWNAINRVPKISLPRN